MSIRHNTAYNLLGSIIPLAVSLVTVPIYIELIGESRYGILAIAWLLLGYFGLFDLGLGRATAQRIAALREGTAEERAQTFWTAIILNAGFGIAGGLLIWPVADYYFANVFKIEAALRPETIAAVPWLVLAVPMATLSGVLSGALQGRERFLELNLISVGGTTLFQLLPLGAAVLFGADLRVILPAVLIARVVSLALLYDRCQRDIVQNVPIRFNGTQSRQLLSFGGWVTVTSFVGPLMTIVDRFIIGTVIGAKAVTYYTVPLQLAERSSILSKALTNAMFPRFTGIPLQEQKSLASEGTRVLAVVMTPLVMAGILFMEPFFKLWISPEFANESSVVGQILLLGMWLSYFARISILQLQAQGRPDLVAKCHLVELIPYFVLLYLGLNYFGVIGAAAAFSLRVFIDFVFVAFLANNLKSSFYILKTPVILLLVTLSIGFISKKQQEVFFGAALVVLLFAIFWSFKQAPSSLKSPAINFLRRFHR